MDARPSAPLRDRAPKTRLRVAFSLALLGLLSACHTIQLGAPARVLVEGERLEQSAAISLASGSRSFSSGLGGTDAGLMHRFILEIGPSLDAYAQAYCNRAFEAGEEFKIEIEVVSFDLEEGAGRLVTEFVVRQAGEEVFRRRYDVFGPPRPGLPGFPRPELNAGVAAEGSIEALGESLRRTLHDVLTLTVGSFFRDFREQLNSAAIPDEV